MQIILALFINFRHFLHFLVQIRQNLHIITLLSMLFLSLRCQDK